MPNWEQMFVPDSSVVESFLRATVIYLSLLILFRVVLKRQSGSIGLPDVMLIVLVSECVSASLNAEAKSIPSGLAAVFALLFWNYALDWLAYRWPWLERRLEPQPLQLIRDGQRLRENMDAEDVTDEELLAQLRLKGIDDITKVKAAFIESEGMISVIPMEGQQSDAKPSELQPESGENAPDFESALKRFLTVSDELRAALAGMRDGPRVGAKLPVEPVQS